MCDSNYINCSHLYILNDAYISNKLLSSILFWLILSEIEAHTLKVNLFDHCKLSFSQSSFTTSLRVKSYSNIMDIIIQSFVEYIVSLRKI